MTQRLRFGVIAGNHNAVDKITELAKTAERHGFDHFLLSDHYWYPREPNLLESWAMIAYLSSITSTIKLGTCVTPITFRPPLQFAKLVSTLDNATRGRIIVGVGAGWLREEFRMFSRWYPNKQRFEQFGEALQILIAAWTKKSVTFHGKYYNTEGSIVEPKPIQKPHPPLFFGGWGPRLLRLAGKSGDGWVTTGPRSGEGVKNPREYGNFVQEIKRGLDESDNPQRMFTYGCRFGPLQNPKKHLGEIEEFISSGLNCYQLGLKVERDGPEFLAKFADLVMSSF